MYTYTDICIKERQKQSALDTFTFGSIVCCSSLFSTQTSFIEWI